MALGSSSESGEGTVENFVRYGSILVPVFDAWPSSAIGHATFDPINRTATFHFKSGDIAEHDCDIATWIAYKASGSRGSFYNANFRGR